MGTNPPVLLALPVAAGWRLRRPNGAGAERGGLMKRLRAISALAASAASVIGPRAIFAQSGPLRIGIVTSYSGGDNVALGKQFDAAIATWTKLHGEVAG